MIRFIINFFLFGFLFFLIYTYFPDAFVAMYNWANEFFMWMKNLFETHVTKTDSPPNA